MGLETALSEITLVFFTTLAPSGALAVAIMGLPMVMGKVSPEQHRRLDMWLCIPLVVTMVGLVASATHLGNPSNALYVFTGAGRSPLSNEVTLAVSFLLFTGLYWLYSFAERPRSGMQRAWMAVIVVAAAAFIAGVAFAYNARTIITWHTPLVPVILWLNACVGGPLIAMAGFVKAGFEPAQGTFGKALLGLSAAATLACTVALAVQNGQLADVANYMASATQLVGPYGLMIAAFCALCLVGAGIDGVCLVRRGALALAPATCGAVFALAGISIIRFAFYMMHMTVGLAV